MPRSFQYEQDLDVFSVEPDGTLTTRYYGARADGEGWRQQFLAGPRASGAGFTKQKSRVGSGITITRDYQGLRGRLDVFTDADGGGVVHAYLIPSNKAWKSEVL